jgi:hypothetical protein
MTDAGSIDYQSDIWRGYSASKLGEMLRPQRKKLVCVKADAFRVLLENA